jgi:hypothetical protein
MKLANFSFLVNTDFRRVYFIFLLPVFFVSHGISEHLNLIQLDEAFFLVLQLVAVQVLLYLLFRLFFKDSYKAAIAAFTTLGFYIFFGSFHDYMKSLFSNSFVVKYSVFLPLLFIFYSIIIYGLKKKAVTIRFVKFLNTLFIILILTDTGVIISKSLMNRQKPFRIAYDKPTKPDVFLIVLDGYAGKKQLMTSFQFENSEFLDSLKKMGFWVAEKSNSNYNATPFSTSSMLNMEFLDLKSYEYTDENLNHCYRKIANSKVVSAFKGLDYDFFNFSIFDFGKKKSIINKTFLISGIKLITSQTLFNRIKKDIFYNLLMNHFRGSRLYRQFIYSDMYNNDLLYQKTLETASIANEKPKFVYTHLMMPHFPYYYNEHGQLNPIESIGPESLNNSKLYFSYLKGVNKKIILLINDILQTSPKPPVVLLLSDHGYRDIIKDSSLYFSNLSAVYLPSKSYSSYYPTISNVNQFRVLFNTLFNQRFSLLPDIQVQ